MEAYLHFGGPFTADKDGPRVTKQVEVKRSLLDWQKRGLMYTATGYGSQIPTTYMVKWSNRWRRVYCHIYSNTGVCYIKSKGKPLATVDVYHT